MVLFPTQGDAPEKYRANSITVITLGEHDGYYASDIPAITHQIKKYSPVIVYGNNFSGSIRNAAIASILARQPFVWHIREMLRANHRRRTYFFLRFAKRIVAVSDACASTVRKIVPTDKQIHVIHNGIDIDSVPVTDELRQAARTEVLREFGLPPNAQVVLALGSICYRKGQDYLLHAASQIHALLPNVHFLIVGQNLKNERDYFHELLALRDRYGLEEHVHFGVFRQNVSSLLMGADILLHTARSEPFARVVIEALAAQTPVVAFGIDGSKEAVINGETGYLIEPFDTFQLASQTISLLQNEALLKQMGKKAREDVSVRLSAHRISRQIETILECL